MARRVTSDREKRRADLKDKLLAYGKTGPLESVDPKDVVGVACGLPVLVCAHLRDCLIFELRNKGFLVSTHAQLATTYVM